MNQYLNNYKDNSNDNKFTKLEIWYNFILKTITIVAIIILTVLFFILVKNIFFGIGNFLAELENATAKPEIILGLPFGIALGAYMIVPLIIFDILIYLCLIIVAFKLRKIKTRKAKGREILFLIGFAFAAYIINFSTVIFNFENNNSSSLLNYAEMFTSILPYIVYVEIILLIVIMLKRKGKNNIAKIFVTLVLVIGIVFIIRHYSNNSYKFQFNEITNDYRLIYKIDNNHKLYSKFEKNYAVKHSKENLSDVLNDGIITFDDFLVLTRFIERGTTAFRSNSIIYESYDDNVYLIKCGDILENQNYYLTNNREDYQRCYSVEKN